MNRECALKYAQVLVHSSAQLHESSSRLLMGQLIVNSKLNCCMQDPVILTSQEAGSMEALLATSR